MRMRDEVGTVFEDEDFAKLFPGRGRPAFSPWRLALATIMQFSEDLSDRQAADAVRGRIDWKYALSLELDDPGFDASVLCEFRTRLLEGGEERLLFDALLGRFREMGLVKARGRQRTDSTHVLGATRNLERLELVGEAMRRALNALAVAAPGWLRRSARAEWARSYARPFDDRRLPKGKDERRKEAEGIGRDGFELLGAVLTGEGAPAWLAELPDVETMRVVWVQNYLLTSDGDVRFRDREDGLPPAAKRLASPTRRSAPPAGGRSPGAATRSTSPRPATRAPLRRRSSRTSGPPPRPSKTPRQSLRPTRRLGTEICSPPSTWWTGRTWTRGACWSPTNASA
jgi:transposase